MKKATHSNFPLAEVSIGLGVLAIGLFCLTITNSSSNLLILAAAAAVIGLFIGAPGYRNKIGGIGIALNFLALLLLLTVVFFEFPN